MVSLTVLCLTGVQITECASLFLFCLVVLNHCFILVYTHSNGNAYSQLGKQSPRVSRQLSPGLAPLFKAFCSEESARGCHSGSVRANGAFLSRLWGLFNQSFHCTAEAIIMDFDKPSQFVSNKMAY